MADTEWEWEWEYDNNETEELYFTIDLTTHVPPTFKKKKPTFTRLPAEKRIAAAEAARDAETAETPTENADAENESRDATIQPTASPPPEHSALQIIDLHSRNPLLYFGNQFYTCHWGSDIGTSMFLTAPGTSSKQHALRSYPSFNLLATTSARLVGVPTTVEPRITPLETGQLLRPEKAADDVVSETTEGDILRYSATQGLRIETQKAAAPEKISQARFLERLSAVKIKKGEKDAVPVSFMRNYDLPDNWEAERDEWLAKDLEGNEQARQEFAARKDIISKRQEQKHQSSARKKQQQQRKTSKARVGEDFIEDASDEDENDDDANESYNEDIEDDVVQVLDNSEDDHDVPPSTNRTRKSTTPRTTAGQKRARTSDGVESEPPKKRWTGPTGRPPGRPRQIRLDEDQVVIGEHSTADAMQVDGRPEESHSANAQEEPVKLPTTTDNDAGGTQEQEPIPTITAPINELHGMEDPVPEASPKPEGGEPE